MQEKREGKRKRFKRRKGTNRPSCSSCSGIKMLSGVSLHRSLLRLPRSYLSGSGANKRNLSSSCCQVRQRQRHHPILSGIGPTLLSRSERKRNSLFPGLFVPSSRPLSSSASRMSSLFPPVEICSDLKSCDFDAVVVVADKVSSLPFDELKKPLQVRRGFETMFVLRLGRQPRTNFSLLDRLFLCCSLLSSFL